MWYKKKNDQVKCRHNSEYQWVPTMKGGTTQTFININTCYIVENVIFFSYIPIYVYINFWWHGDIQYLIIKCYFGGAP